MKEKIVADAPIKMWKQTLEKKKKKKKKPNCEMQIIHSSFVLFLCVWSGRQNMDGTNARKQ